MRHKSDVYPLPEDKQFLYINEPWVIDKSIYWETGPAPNEPEDESDNVRVYMPVDLNANAIMRRLHYVIDRYKEATFNNEMKFSTDVAHIVYLIEIYDQVWFTRAEQRFTNEDGLIIGHSKEGVELVRKVIAELEEIPDIDSDIFPFYTIDELKKDYLDWIEKYNVSFDE